MLRKIFGSERDEVSWDRRRSHNERLHEFYWSDQIKNNGTGGASGASAEYERCIQGFGWEDQRETDDLEDLGLDGKIMTQKKWDGIVDRIDVSQDITSGGVCEHGYRVPVSIKFDKFLDYLKNYWSPKKNSSQWSWRLVSHRGF